MASFSALPPTQEAGCVVGEQWRARVVIISALGDVDMLTAPLLDAVVDTALKKCPSAVILDLSAVDFLALRGVSVLLRVRDEMPTDALVVAVVAGPATRRPLKLLGVDQLVPLFESIDEAVEATSR